MRLPVPLCFNNVCIFLNTSGSLNKISWVSRNTYTLRIYHHHYHAKSISRKKSRNDQEEKTINQKNQNIEITISTITLLFKSSLQLWALPLFITFWEGGKKRKKRKISCIVASSGHVLQSTPCNFSSCGWKLLLNNKETRSKLGEILYSM